MAHYAYKNVVYDLIPVGFRERFVRDFEQNSGTDFDGDPNYDGDEWLLTEAYIKSLKEEISDLKERLRKK